MYCVTDSFCYNPIKSKLMQTALFPLFFFSHLQISVVEEMIGREIMIQTGPLQQAVYMV